MPINLRMMNLFRPDQDDQFNQATQPMIQPEPFQQQPQMQEPTNESLQRFLSMQMPERQNPSTLSKIGATLMSLKANPEQVDKSLHSNYYRDMDDYNAKSKPLLEGARIESTQNNYRSLNNDRLARNETANRRIDTTAATANNRTNATILNNQERTRIANAKLELDRQKLKLQGATLKAVKGGNFVWFLPDGRRLDTGQSTNEMSEQAQMALEQEYALDRISAQGDNSLKNIAANTAGQMAIKGSGNGAGETGNAHMAKVKSRAQALIRVDPSYEELITFDPQGGVVIDASIPPGARKMIQEYLDGGAVPSQESTTPGMPPKQPGMEALPGPANKTPIGGRPDPIQPMSSHGNGLPPMQMMNSRGTGQVQLNQAGKITVTKDGKTSQVSERNLQKAIADGWTVGQ